MYDFMKDEGALEFGIRNSINLYADMNDTSKREAVLAANEIIKKIAKEVQQEEFTGYSDTDSAKTVKEQACDDFRRIMNIFELDYMDILLFMSSGVMDMLKHAMKEKRASMSAYLLALHKALDDVVSKYENQGVFEKKGGEK